MAGEILRPPTPCSSLFASVRLVLPCSPLFALFILFASFAFVRLFKLPDLLFKVVRLGPFDVEVLVAIEFASIRTVPNPVRETWVNRRCPVILLGHVLQQWSSFTVLRLAEPSKSHILCDEDTCAE